MAKLAHDIGVERADLFSTHKHERAWIDNTVNSSANKACLGWLSNLVIVLQVCLEALSLDALCSELSLEGRGSVRISVIMYSNC